MRVALAAPNSSSSRGRRIRGTRTVFYFVTTDCNNFVADGTVHDKQDVTQVGRSRLWAVTFDDVTKIATDG